METKKNAIAYIRVSTEKQAKEGVSLDAQIEQIEAYCKFKSINLVDIIKDEGISGGKNRARGGFVDLLDQIQTGEYESLILFDLSRLSRDMLTLLALERLLEEHDVELHTIEGMVDTSTPDGFMSFAMRAFMGEMERRQVKYRTKKAMQYKKSQGRIVGSVPFGFNRKGDELVKDAKEQKVIKKVNTLHKNGLTLIKIVRKLESIGIVSRNGKPFTSQQVKRMIEGYENLWQKRNTNLTTNIRQFVTAIG